MNCTTLLYLYFAFLAKLLAAQELLPHLLYFPDFKQNLQVYHSQQCSAYNSSASDLFFNRVYISEQHLDKQEIEHVKNFFGTLPHSWWIPSYCTDAHNTLKYAGYSFIQANTEMVCDLTKNTFNAPDTECTVTLLDSTYPLDRATWITTAAQGFGCDRESIVIFFDYLMKAYDLEKLHMYIVHAEGTPVSTALAITHTNYVTLHLGSTIAQHRTKGYGSALLKKMCADAQAQNYAYAALLASDKGKGIYKAQGFEERSIYFVFA